MFVLKNRIKTVHGEVNRFNLYTDAGRNYDIINVFIPHGVGWFQIEILADNKCMLLRYVIETR
jgi:hypothetical protein